MTFNTLLGNNFTFENPEADILIDVIHDKDDPKHGLKTFTIHHSQNPSKTIPFSFWGMTEKTKLAANGKITHHKGIARDFIDNDNFSENHQYSGAQELKRKTQYASRLVTYANHILPLITEKKTENFNDNLFKSTLSPINALMAISPKNLSPLMDFTKNYGFLFNIPSGNKNSYTELSGKEISQFISLFQHLYKLQLNISACDYDKIAKEIYNILLIPPLELTYNNASQEEGNSIDKTCRNYKPASARYTAKNIIHEKKYDIYEILSNNETNPLMKKEFDKYTYSSKHFESTLLYKNIFFETKKHSEGPVSIAVNTGPLFYGSHLSISLDPNYVDQLEVRDELTFSYIYYIEKASDDITKNLLDLLLYVHVTKKYKFFLFEFEKISNQLIEMANYIIEQEFNAFFSKIVLSYDFSANLENIYSTKAIIPDLYTALLLGITYRFCQEPMERYCKYPCCNKLFKLTENTYDKKQLYHSRQCKSKYMKYFKPQQRYFEDIDDEYDMEEKKFSFHFESSDDF